jgi:hypothetical protein
MVKEGNEMNAIKYTAEDMAKLAEVPLCLVHYYAQIRLLGERPKQLEIPSAKGLELVDLDEFIQCETKALHLACSKMTELIQQQRTISQLQEHLETWIFEYCFKTVNKNSTSL